MIKTLLWVFATVFILMACTKNDQTAMNQASTNVVAAAPSTPNQPNHIETFEFIAYNDNGDYQLLFAKNGNGIVSFVNDEVDDRSLLRGDTCEITWKVGTIDFPENDQKESANLIVSIKKVKDGLASTFRKTYPHKLTYHWSKDSNYSKSYLDEIYLTAEYYIANSKNALIQQAILNKEPIEFSIERQIKDKQDYEVLGIGHTSDGKFSVMQWIYIAGSDGNVFEYDIANDQLNEF